MGKSVIIIVFLVLINGTLFLVDHCRRKDISNQLNNLKQKKVNNGTPEEAINEEDLEDEIEPKQRYSWVIGIMICLDIWLVGAVLTHLWAESFFDDVQQETVGKHCLGIVSGL